LIYKLKMAAKDQPENFTKYVPLNVARKIVDNCMQVLKAQAERSGSVSVADIRFESFKSKDIEAQRASGCAVSSVEEDGDVEELESKASDLPTVTVIGDTHGHFQDFVHLMNLAGSPSESSYFVFNGDFVDRGSWGTEILLSILAWKVALPEAVTVVRGNHESEYCTSAYGFKNELSAKFPEGNAAKSLYSRCLSLFANLPLAAVVDDTVCVLHGGLFRKPLESRTRRGASEPRFAMKVGNLQDLRKASSGGLDPDGTGNSVIASDVMWSDPTQVRGMRLNESRGIGLEFGPDATEEFLHENGLKLVVRSHEGPDAREKRPFMKSIHSGYSEDHVGPSGKLVTLFSAPDYPMCGFKPKNQIPNDAAFLVLEPPDYSFEPQVVSFKVSHRPRPTQYYEDCDAESD